MRRVLIALTLSSLWLLPGAARAVEPFVQRPHYIHERQLIPDRRTSYDAYYLRKYGRLPPFTTYAPSNSVVLPGGAVWTDALPPGVSYSNLWVPGYGYVPQ